MDIDRLRYFVTVSNVGSIRAAAQLLRLSPPAISKAIKILEAELGVTLVAAAGRGLVLTVEGRRVAARGRRLLDDLAEAERDLRLASPVDAPLRLATFEVFSTYFIAHAASGVLRGMPLEMLELPPNELEEAVAAGRVDYGLTYLPVPRPEIDYLPVATVAMAIYGLRARFHKTEFADLPFSVPAAPPVGGPTRITGLDGWPDDRFKRRVQYRVTLMQTALCLCSEGLAVGYLPSFVVQLYNATVVASRRLETLPAPAALAGAKQQVFLVRRSGVPDSPRLKALARALKSLVK